MSETSNHLLPNVKSFLQEPSRMLIAGEWVSARSGREFPVENPATGQVIYKAPYGEREDVHAAVAAARKAFDNGPWRNKMTASERARLVSKLGDLVEKHADALAQLECLDNGKPYKVARVADIPLAIDMFHYMSGWATKIHGETFPISVPYDAKTRYLAYTLKEPVGVVGQIIPWNFPLLMAVWKLAPALASGCCVVLKPAEQTPLSALYLGKLIQEAGFPPGVVNIVTGFGDAGAELVVHPKVDKVAFTGSTEVGKKIVENSIGNLKRISLELGGKSPNILFSDCDLTKVIPGAASSIFFNHGQCCCAGSRLFVQEPIYDQVVEGVRKMAEKIKVGDGFQSTTEMGPLVSREQQEKACGYIQSGVQQGAKVQCGGGALEASKGYFVKPTVVTGAHSDMKMVKEEIFGPVVTIFKFKETEEVIAKANDSIYGLAAGVWTQDLAKAHYVSAQLQAGTTWINCYNIFDAALPFGGYKESGWGREMGQEVLRNYTETKAVCLPVGQR